MIQDAPITVIAKALYCDMYTVLKFGTALGLLPQERLKKRKPYIPKEAGVPLKHRNDGKTYHRRIWKAAVSAHSHASRSELIHLAHKSYEWLRANDLVWFEKNSPAPKKGLADWNSRDDEYMELVETVVSSIKGFPGRPIWINMNSVGKKSGISNLHGKIASGRLPQTAAYLAHELETMAEWRKRKILWAIHTLRERGEKLTLNKVTLTASISREAAKRLKSFIIECLEID